MSKLMLIDAVHPEETRVALVSNGQVDDFDFETTGKEQLRGNIYLAKVTRVEPSLQACFVDYGGNRHGFLAFSEIHPDYYQLPQEDREALLQDAARAAAENEDLDVDDPDEEIDSPADLIDDDDNSDEDASDGEPETRKKSSQSHSKRYKIQEVIRRRQVMLVQVVKEERGNKGAALTTFLSLAGRYSVLMPNTPRGGGISRKISNGSDRKRLKDIMGSLDVPQGMGLIVRTAGAKRTKTEIKRDYEYLQKLWDNIRSKTLESIAPCLIHEEGGLVHRAMRDMFDKDIEEVIIQGQTAYREAKDLSKMIMPTQARKVKQWKSQAPLFVSENVEEQLDSIFSPVVQMKSGGYLVINQTEALVAIDVNSGKATRERNIEQTALRTNLEAAEEACRQMRLRDLAGLVVIDFIDMEENKNNRAVEKKLKDCLKIDRARVQCGKISQFGLMEISRQRRRAGVLQATSDPCDACNGTGRRRSVPSAALQLLRTLEARAAGGGLASITVHAPTEVALYLLNNKREAITEIEDEAGFAISVRSSDDLLPGDFKIDAEKDPSRKSRRKSKSSDRSKHISGDDDDDLLPQENDDSLDSAEDEIDEDAKVDSEATDATTEDEKSSQSRKRRRRGRRGGRRRRRESGPIVPADGGALLDGLSVSAPALLDDEPPALPDPQAANRATSSQPQLAKTVALDAEKADDQESEKKPSRRRRSRGGRRNKSTGTDQVSETAATEPGQAGSENVSAPSEGSINEKTDNDVPDAELKSEPDISEPSSPAPPVDETAIASEVVASDAGETPQPANDADQTSKDKDEGQTATTAVVFDADKPLASEPVLVSDENGDEKEAKPKRRGWWSRGK
ncbi:Rne/Rng family ribonuclease [Henriciella mobilis]|uniref:Rne/Rng family ribonuclease n=1 Tax=Henriciella mobilis TaxID=2305467 RepID=UPI000E662DCD|nr:Rne/Rng family ribonuclease [Henriciella mobilis]RIJ15330.1 Rne/Rng family ribonuclease [Henriciella mobilis]RIJ18794.1 Rne/Rng family ribonuclease [Henriciella mobilis]